MRVTASLGVVQYDGREALDELVTRADQALYRAKGEGRNRVASERREPPPQAIKRAVGD